MKTNKLATIFFALIWMTSSALIPDHKGKIVKYQIERKPDGNHEYIYETDNGIYSEEKRTIKSSKLKDDDFSVKGSFLYTSPEGLPIHLTYTADKRGFHPQGDHLPTPPPIPPQILRALVWIADQKQRHHYELLLKQPNNNKKLKTY